MCYYDMSLPADYDQTPSQLTIDAVESFASRYPGDERLPDLRTKQAEMQERIAQQQLLTAKFYEKRRKFGSAKIYYEVVVDKYPDSEAAQTASAWLDTHQGVEHIGSPLPETVTVQ